MSTYTPGLHGVQLPPRDAHALIYRHGWREPLNMVRLIATLIQESQLYTKAVGQVNPDGSQDFGLFQLNDGHWERFAATRDAYVERAFDPEDAAFIARQLWADDQRAGGSGFRPWAAFTTGAYKKNLPVACTSLANYAAVQLIGQPVI